uniref:Uncharacterized protein n=1 Tax=Arundo donax TaxID=35708 RepID=A0A0A9FNT7_ARUDO
MPQKPQSPRYSIHLSLSTTEIQRCRFHIYFVVLRDSAPYSYG